MWCSEKGGIKRARFHFSLEPFYQKIFFSLGCSVPRPYSAKRAYFSKLKEIEKELIKRKKAAEREKKRKQIEKDKEMATLLKKQQALARLRRQRYSE